MLELIQPSEKCIVTGSSSRGGRRTLLSRTRGRPSAAGATARRLSGASNHGGLHRGNRLRRTQPMQAVALAPLGDPDLKQLDATGGLLRRRPPPVRSGSGKDQVTTRADRCDDGGRVHRLDARHCRRHRTRQMRRRLVLHLSLEAAGAIVPRSDLTIYLYRLLLHERSESVRPRTDSMARAPRDRTRRISASTVRPGPLLGENTRASRSWNGANRIVGVVAVPIEDPSRAGNGRPVLRQACVRPPAELSY